MAFKIQLDNDVHGVVLCITLFTPIANPHSLAVDTLVMLSLTGMYDLLSFDLRMPGMNGFELYSKIKDLEDVGKKVRNGKPRVCFIIAFEDLRSEFKETFPILEEVDCFLKKPIPMPDLVMKVKSQLGLL